MMTTTAVHKTRKTLGVLPWQVTPTTLLAPGDVFTTDAGTGVLVFVSRPSVTFGYRRSVRDPLRAIDLSGQHHDVYAGARVRKLLDLDTLPACDVCKRGCDCEQGQPGCDHFACWGTGTDAGTTCPGAVAQRVALYQSVARRTR